MTKPDQQLFDFNTAYDGPSIRRNSLFTEDFDLSYLLPKSFLDDDFWADLLTSLAAVLDDQAHAPLAAMSHIRIPEAQGRIYKALHAKMMGYDIKDDVMTDAGYDRLNNNLGGYLYEQGGDSFIYFLGYVLGMKLALVRLWTKDYVNFYPSHGVEKTVFEGGDWYPTTHVGVIYDTNDNVSTTLPATEDELVELFYKHAPVDLVLKWIAANTTILLGTLYMQVFDMSKTEVRCDINARGDLDITCNMQMLTFHKGRAYGQSWWPRSRDTFYISAKQREKSIEHLSAQSSILFWKASDGPLDDVLTGVGSPVNSTRATVAWRFTGIGAGEWVQAGEIRYNVNPVTGEPLGILQETDTQNYVRSSANVGAEPWEIVGAPTYVNLPTDGMDSTNILQWTATSAADAVCGRTYLPAGTFAAQVVYRNYSGGVNHVNGNTPSLEVLGLGSSVETGLADPYPEFTTVYPAEHTILFTDDVSLGGSWRLASLVFTLDTDSHVRLVLPVNGRTAFFYAGIEPGDALSSFVPTGDCMVSVRGADLFYLQSPQYEQGSVNISYNRANFLGEIAVEPENGAFEFIAFDEFGNIRFQVTTGPTSASDIAIKLISYDDVDAKEGVNPTETFYPLPLQNNPTAVDPKLFFSWSKTGGAFNVNGLDNVYANRTTISTARIGPGWRGHIDALSLCPIAISAALMSDVQTALEGA
jgi:hypothetical protein